MNRKIIFPKFKNVYKGNLHTHSTRSDGSYELNMLTKAYKEKGYRFICVSDHHNYYISSIKDNEEFILLDGMEGGVGWSNYHIHAIGDYNENVECRIKPDQRYPIDDTQTPQQTIDEYINQGNICIINHPRWTGLEYEELLEVDNIVGLEVYNTNCERESSTGYAEDYWDYMLRHGKKVFAFASDDGHAEDIDCPVSEYFGGWICVSSDILGKKDIVKSIKSGDFYASNGPIIKSIQMEGRKIFVETEAVKQISFITHPPAGKNFYNRDGQNISKAEYEPDENVEYVRVEVTDEKGKKAWLNPIFYK